MKNLFALLAGVAALSSYFSQSSSVTVHEEFEQIRVAGCTYDHIRPGKTCNHPSVPPQKEVLPNSLPACRYGDVGKIDTCKEKKTPAFPGVTSITVTVGGSLGQWLPGSIDGKVTITFNPQAYQIPDGCETEGTLDGDECPSLNSVSLGDSSDIPGSVVGTCEKPCTNCDTPEGGRCPIKHLCVENAGTTDLPITIPTVVISPTAPQEARDQILELIKSSFCAALGIDCSNLEIAGGTITVKLDCTKCKMFESEHRRACGLVTKPGDWCAIPKVADPVTPQVRSESGGCPAPSSGTTVLNKPLQGNRTIPIRWCSTLKCTYSEFLKTETCVCLFLPVPFCSCLPHISVLLGQAKVLNNFFQNRASFLRPG